MSMDAETISFFAVIATLFLLAVGIGITYALKYPKTERKSFLKSQPPPPFFPPNRHD